MLSRHFPITRRKLFRSPLTRSICFTPRLQELDDSSAKGVNRNPSQSNADNLSRPIQPTPNHIIQQTKTSTASNDRQAISQIRSPPSFSNPQRVQGRYSYQHSPTPPRADPRQPFAKYGPPSSYPHHPQNYPPPPRDMRRGPPSWSGNGSQAAQWQPSWPNHPQPTYSQSFQYNQVQQRGPYQPRGSGAHGTPQMYPNQPQFFGPRPDGIHGASQPHQQAFQGPWRGPRFAPEGPARRSNPASGPYNPVRGPYNSAFGTPPSTSARDPQVESFTNKADSGPSNSSLASVLAARRKQATGSNQSYGLDMSDVSGLHTLDQFVGNQPSQPTFTPQSPREPRAMGPSYQASWDQAPHQYKHQPAYGPTRFSKGPRHEYMGTTPPSFGQSLATDRSPMREGPGWNPNRGEFAARGGTAGARGAGRGGVNRGRGRGNTPGQQRGRGRGTLFTKFDEPSLPPPPQSILNERGEFGEEPQPSGSPHGIAGLSGGIDVGSKTDDGVGRETDHQIISKLLLSSSTPIQLPGFEKPIRILPTATDMVQASYEIESGGTALTDPKRRTNVVGRARNLVSQNSSMNLDQKRQAVAVVDFLLLSKEERMQRVI
ncbi:hypothetical protein CROQUDRAFT_88178 [Cronartium quercuum f. sp. fusiforme G11]|uniref:Uncharacterized protein n=1 Tax=Cronartium quercuum f. sp. fusiforme G11 TaxID=708437 RepID=A0A9P6NNF8_9BASI|nr:hypothetical protein CROQUDRAFT_88178 [Cronartium quercuum f. sp. fusiforme G11]